MIHRVCTMPEQKVKSMLVQEVAIDPRKALLTLDLELIESLTATDQEKRSDLHFVHLYGLCLYYYLPVCDIHVVQLLARLPLLNQIVSSVYLLFTP